MQAITLIPTLQNGLDVNVSFGTVFGFENDSGSLGLFKAFGVPLVHGWITEECLPQVEPLEGTSNSQSVTNGQGIGGYPELNSYNQIMEALVDAEVAAIELSGMKDSAISDVSNEIVEEVNRAEGKKAANNNAQIDESEKRVALEKRITMGSMAQDFLSITSTQLTSIGLTELGLKLPMGSLSVLFRNNHFSTLLHHQLGLFTLVTDEGFLTKKCVWESLTVDGDSVFVDAAFNAYTSTASDEALEAVNLDAVDVEEQEKAWKAIVDGEVAEKREIHTEDTDLALAMALQNEEDRAARSRQQSNQNSPRPKPNKPSIQHRQQKEEGCCIQ
ncbi:UNVERIFIED_CONTAM: Ubiquitin carboxyl-terminal hydrolase MINDY-1 [Siphonaria sp. JEL0065]|nr:Ubiquitin carboxyl-terminal hydrolase MINDY-1 [Siphonaria sp. JEL0065]